MDQHIKDLINAVRHPRACWKSSRIPNSPRNGLFRLPPHLLERILELLPLSSQACLVLTCHTLYRIYTPILQDHRLRFPRLLANRDPTISLGQANVPRNIFLRQLQNHKWSFCEACLKLHPRTEMAEGNLCHAHAGIVDLCPCLTLTPRDKFRLVRVLRNISNAKDRRHYSIEQDPRFEVLTDRDPRFPQWMVKKCLRALFHRCTVHYHANVWMDVRIRFYLASKHKIPILVAHTDYKVTLYSRPLLASMTPYFACPHRSLLPWAFHRHWHSSDCLVCDAWLRLNRIPDIDGKERDVHVVRDLGGFRWPPDIRWEQQCRLRDPVSYKRLWVNGT
ncbi:hypothetical protein BO78DRAFT_399328 [Aspergillus sclerotiicarbonarius CBS 121057]|uniref:F-box domain-containing protein n=1 Tax=Aspergillus sclerotiicarbonarius (strain CBS 121057 / IBT 28362) TaxID=1448318 RepID=A0A319ESK2_ASPSB|nr:hypothetical protein BO78DRAFT_399328 [Aspergillus sclerotiicarbonarius CBS 121057]